ncbi:MAG: hypothetical protein DBX03_00230, partial [Puniceicoccaceae bacterium]
GGFIAKFLLFYACFEAGLYGLLAVAVVGVVVSIYYYFAWVRSIVTIPDMEEARITASEPVTIPLSKIQRAFLVGIIALVLIVGLFPRLFSHFI